MTKKYEVKFELFGKKLKVVIDADNQEHAKAVVRSRIKFYGVRYLPNYVPNDMHKDIPKDGSNKEDDTLNRLMDMFGMR